MKEYTNKSKSETKYCRVCKVELTLDNTILSVRKEDYCCRSCFSKANKKWKKENCVHSFKNGKNFTIYGNNKRIYPQDNLCEICKQENKGYQLQYHHWNDDDLSLGLYLCHSCHFICNGVEKMNSGVAKKYLELKIKIGGGEKHE